MSNEKEKTEYEKSYDKALLIWDNLTNVKKKKDDLCETNECPMHPYLFFQLSSGSNFNYLNGNNYSDYIEKWKKKYIVNY